MAVIAMAAPFSRPVVRRRPGVLSRQQPHARRGFSRPCSDTSLESRHYQQCRSVRGTRTAEGDCSSTYVKNNYNGSKKDIYVLLAACLAGKLYSVFKQKTSMFIKAKTLIKEKNYITIAPALFAIAKATYEAFKLVKDIRELINY